MRPEFGSPEEDRQRYDRRLIELMQRFVSEASLLYEPHRIRPIAEETYIGGPRDAYDLLRQDMESLAQEQLRVLTLNRKNHLIASPTIYQGTAGGVHVRPAEVFRPAILDGAVAIIVAHNHPSGIPDPSPEDVVITRELNQVGQLLSIELLDHLIIGHNDYTSMRERGLGFT